mmetsp:Transcript_5902/g.12931  ORF Transcript_5902/g.12931 Transcript_5902/m.12931 type:complete len:249 (-) Transcript_5902:235-981(-)
MVNAHPTLEGPAHVFETPLQLSTRGFHPGQSIKSRKRQRIISRVGDGGPAYETRDGILGQHKVGDRSRHAVDIVFLHNFHLVGAHVHGPRGLARVLLVESCHLRSGRTEWLDQKARSALAIAVSPAASLEEGTETKVGCLLVGLVGTGEFEHGELFGGEAEGGDSLAAVDVEGPDGLAEDAGDSWEKIGDGGAGVIVVEDVATGLIEKLCILLRLGHSMLLHSLAGLGLKIVMSLAQQTHAVRRWNIV